MHIYVVKVLFHRLKSELCRAITNQFVGHFINYCKVRKIISSFRVLDHIYMYRLEKCYIATYGIGVWCTLLQLLYSCTVLLTSCTNLLLQKIVEYAKAKCQMVFFLRFHRIPDASPLSYIRFPSLREDGWVFHRVPQLPVKPTQLAIQFAVT